MVRPFALNSAPLAGSPGSLRRVEDLPGSYLVLINTWTTPSRELLQQVLASDRPANTGTAFRALAHPHGGGLYPNGSLLPCGRRLSASSRGGSTSDLIEAASR